MLNVRPICFLILLTVFSAGVASAQIKLDSDFGTHGVVVHHFDDAKPADNFFRTMRIDRDDSIVAAGSDYDRGLVAIRYSPEGKIVWKFSQVLLENRSQAGYEIIHSMLLDGDSTILVGRTSKPSAAEDEPKKGAANFVVVKLDKDGKLDSKFGDGAGYVVHQVSPNLNAFLPAQSDIAYGVLKSNDRLFVSGTLWAGLKRTSVGLTAFEHSGKPDKTFNDNAAKSLSSYPRKEMICLPQRHTYRGMEMILHEGKITLVTNAKPDGKEWQFGLTRINLDGTLDKQFGKDGLLLFPALDGEQSDNACETITFDNHSNQFVLSGYVNATHDPKSTRQLAVVRCDADGKLDKTFGNDGVCILKDYGFPGGTEIHGPKAAVAADGTIAVVGAVANSEGRQCVGLAVISPDGKKTEKIAPKGLGTSSSGPYDMAWGVEFDSKMRIVVAGFATQDDGRCFVVARYLLK